MWKRILLGAQFGLLFSIPAISQFQEVGSQWGIDHLHTTPLTMGGGAVFFDYNNDGFLDLYATGGLTHDKLYRNLGDGRFIDVSSASLVKESTLPFHSFGVVAGDINNDGCEDLFISTFEDQPNILLLNGCDGTFTDISKKAGITHSFYSSGAIFLDYNQDSYLDIYVINYIDQFQFTKDEQGLVTGIDGTCQPNLFYVNNGDQTFTEKAEAMGIDNVGCGLAIAATDFDMDGDLDIYLANDHGPYILPNSVFQNNYPEDSFSDVAEIAGLNSAIFSMGIAVGDYDENGKLDYYITNVGKNVLLANNGQDRFLDVTTQAGVDDDIKNDGADISGWGTFFFDFDNDTDLDLFVSNGFIRTGFGNVTTPNDPNALYRNDGDGTFTNLASDYGLDDRSINRGSICGDYDNDGDLDLFVVTTEAFEGNVYSLMYQNMLSGENNWLEVQLEGTVSNRDAIGALTTLFLDGRKLIRELSGGGSFASQNANTIHYGLGTITKIDSLKVQWPNSTHATFHNIPISQKIYIREGADQIEILGCTEAGNTLFNPAATRNTGCLQSAFLGCTDSNATNYDPNAEIEDGSCEYTQVVTGIADPSDESFRLYPLPIENELYLSLEDPSSTNYDLVIYDLFGRVMFIRKNWIGNGFRINTQRLHAGPYILLITPVNPSGRIITRKLIKL